MSQHWAPPYLLRVLECTSSKAGASMWRHVHNDNADVIRHATILTHRSHQRLHSKRRRFVSDASGGTVERDQVPEAISCQDEAQGPGARDEKLHTAVVV